MRHLNWLAVLLFLIMGMEALAGPRDADWKKVEEAINKGLPKTAIEALQPIIESALKDKAYAEAAKAIARRITLEGQIQGNKPEEKILRLEAEIAKAPKELAPIFDTILAEWYWQYFQQNQWRFMQRTATAETPGKDFTTWDLPRLFAEIDKQFQKALSAAGTLKKIPISSYNDLLQKGTLPDKYRPTLYDFIAQQALAFYTSGEQAAAKPQDHFEVSADSPIFDDAEKFMAWKPNGGPADSPVLRAIRLYQDLLAFHHADEDKTAFIDVDLARLVNGKNIAVGEGGKARFKTAVKSLAEKWADNELSAEARFQWAQLLREEENLVEARTIALAGARAFPNSPCGKECHNLVGEIELKSCQVTTERVWNNPPAKIEVLYKNVTKVWFRAVAYDWDDFLQKTHSRPEYLNDTERKELLAKTPVLDWSADLPATSDYKERVEELPAPDQLKPGFYFIIASNDPGFGDKDNVVSFTDVWVSELALVVRSRDRMVEGFVLQANSGEPLKGAEVQAWYLDRNQNRIAEPLRTTDENGLFTLPAMANQTYLLRVRYQGQQLGTRGQYTGNQYERERTDEQTIFFTDRAIYRPGQTIQYKGISLSVNADENDYKLLKGRQLTVIFSDANGKEISRQSRQCNDYGSFSGSFTAPRDRLMGAMQIHVPSGPQGATSFRVEEYKRPKFQVKLEAPKTGAKLNEKVMVSGQATSYTGAAIDSAGVKYRVVREVRYPIWWQFRSWRLPNQSGGEEISHGTVKTETDGRFKIEFTAKPDLSVPEKDEPTFNFKIIADVTDNAGETRSDELNINVGYTALQAELTANDWQTDEKPVEVIVKTTTLDGEGQVAEGSIKIYRLQEPAQVQRPRLAGEEWRYYRQNIQKPEKPDLSDPKSWPLGGVAVEKGFTTGTNGEVSISVKLGVGEYRATLETQDRFGKKVTALIPIRVLKPNATKLGIKIPNLVAAPKWQVEPGGDFTALWGTGYDEGRAFIEIEHHNKIIQQYWTRPGETQATIKQAVTESMRGGFTLHVTQVRENRAYLSSQEVDVPWSNKDLKLAWEHFTSKLEPGKKETWTAVITGPNAQKSVAEMVATLYDESFDALSPLAWQQRFSFFWRNQTRFQSVFENISEPLQPLKGAWKQDFVNVQRTYRQFPPDLNWHGYYNRFRSGLGMNDVYFSRSFAMRAPMAEAESFAAPMAAAPAVKAKETPGSRKADGNDVSDLTVAGRSLALLSAQGLQDGDSSKPPVDLSKITARKNLNETAFFFPQLTSDSNGFVRMTFTMPEALTQWRFMGFAHDRELRSGFLQAKAVTSKDLMVQPNPPRFLREGDELEFTVKVSNQTTNRQTGTVRLTFNEALNDISADKLLGNTTPEENFEIPAKESRSYSWKIKVPDGIGFLTYKAVASSGVVSDGEEGNLPVLSRRILVTESLPLPIRGPATKKFDFLKLEKSGGSDTLRHQSLTVQMVSNPAWYAVMALPYLMEFPHECSEQTFNRFYANALARTIATSDPKIRKIFDQWKATPALDSPLEKNQDLKSVAIEETPWLRQAEAESQARRNVGVLFDENRLASEADRTLDKLRQMQLGDGSWPWFPGGQGSDYISLYITTGFGRLRHLGADIDVSPAFRSLIRLDGWIDDQYREILKAGHKDENHLGSTIALYLYGRSFFLKDQPINPRSKDAVDYFLDQARKYWLQVGNRQSQGHLAIALLRFGDQTTPGDIMKSLKERSVSNEEMGMFWRDTENSWWWYAAPIETQALMIEAFDEVAHDTKAVEDCKVWLLKQKQTQDWRTTKATADAVYALLLRGANVLGSDALVEISLGGKTIKPENVEAGTGFYEQKFAGPEVKPKMGEIVVKKVDTGVAWGSVHWQYLEDIAKITPHEGTPLRLKKSLFVKRNTAKGPVLEELKGQLKVGDELVVRIELRTDRDMEFVHMKDQRGSGLEPLNVLSRYKYQDGLGYYESTRDTASHFFIDYLRKGTYVFEYSTRVVNKGRYQSGMAEIQCMYAPEFNSHSESLPIKVE